MTQKIQSAINLGVFILMILISTACDDTICSNLYSPNLTVGFFDQKSRNAKITKFDSITAVGTDSIFYKLDSTSTYLLPANPFADSAIFLFINNGTIDSLFVSYNRTIVVESSDCGYYQIYENVNATYSTFPEVISNNNTLSIKNENNIEIYY